MAIRELTIDEVKTRLGSVHLVDVRENDEWAQGHIPGAQHIPKGNIEKSIARHIPEQGAGIIVYCAGGFRSAAVAEVLQRMGYTDVFSMKGGLNAWSAKRYPVES